MKFRIDESLQKRVADVLTQHVTTPCPDDQALAAARRDNRVVVSADSDETTGAAAIDPARRGASGPTVPFEDLVT